MVVSQHSSGEWWCFPTEEIAIVHLVARLHDHLLHVPRCVLASARQVFGDSNLLLPRPISVA